MAPKRKQIPFSDISVKVKLGSEEISIDIIGLKTYMDNDDTSKSEMARYYTEVLGESISRRTVGRRMEDSKTMDWSEMLKEDLEFAINIRKLKEMEYGKSTRRA